MYNPEDTETFQVHLHSLKGQIESDAGGKSHMSFHLNDPIRDDYLNFSGHSKMEVSLISASIPRYFYNIREGHNTLSFMVWDTTDEALLGPFVYTIPQGHYTLEALTDLFDVGSYTYFRPKLAAKVITSYAPTFTEFFVAAGLDATVEISIIPNAVDGKIGLRETTVDRYVFYIMPDGDHTTQIQGIDVSSYKSTASYQLGLDMNTAFSFDYGATIEYPSYDFMTYPYDPKPIPNIYFCADFARTAIAPWDLNRSNVLGVIPVTADFRSDETYSNAISSEVSLVRDQLTSLTIRIVDHNNDFIDLNNIDWTATIQFRLSKSKAKRDHITAFDKRNHDVNKHPRLGSFLG